MSVFPIPKDALDDRLGFIGTSGSGKTYNAGGAVERLLKSHARIVIVDPLGVWWGLRLQADGKTASPFNVAIFGGPHGDLPLTENAGALIGETAATMAESCIVDLSELGSKSADRRFMTSFLETIYRKAPGEPFHLVVDEADLFAPQKPPKGDETLLNLMEQIVRRGRIRGFIPWLISQRPAVLNKNVLSQVDGLIAFKLTASQDRDALDGWIEGQADKAQGKAIKDSLPAMQIGSGIVWVPGRGVLQTATFPQKETFDSSRTPKRGEKKQKTTALKPLDLSALKGRLATVETEAKANDPRALKAELTKAHAEIKRLSQNPASFDAAKRDVGLEARATAEIAKLAAEAGIEGVRQAFNEAIAPMRETLSAEIGAELSRCAVKIESIFLTRLLAIERAVMNVRATKNMPINIPATPTARAVIKTAPRAPRLANGHDNLTAPQRRVLASIGFWRSVGTDQPSRAQVAGVAGYSPNSGGFNNLIGGLNTAGLIIIPMAGRISLADDAQFDELSPEEARGKVYSVLSGPQRRIVEAALQNPAPATRDAIANATDYSANSGGFNNLIGSLCTLTILTKPAPGHVALSDWAREVLQS